MTSKNPDYVFDEEKTYAVLTKSFPDIFPPAHRVPKEVSHPGNMPSLPLEFHREAIEFSKGDTFEELVQKIKKTGAGDVHFEIKNGSVRCLEKVKNIPQDQLPILEDEDSDFWHNEDDEQDQDSGYDEHGNFHEYRRASTPRPYVPLDFGNVNKIMFHFNVMNEKYHQERDAYDGEKKRWDSHLKNYQERKQDIKRITELNRELYRNARKTHRDLWIAAGRSLKVAGDKSLLSARLEMMQTELRKIEEQLAQDS